MNLQPSIDLFNSEIKFVRKSLRHKYIVTIIHKDGQQVRHESKSVKDYAAKNTEKQLKYSLWLRVHSKTKREWIECISDPEVKEKLYANIKVDLDKLKHPSLFHAISMSGLWQRWPEGKEYWEKVISEILRDELAIESELLRLI